MSPKRTQRESRAEVLRLAWPAFVLLLGLGGAIGCSSYPTFKDVPINCTANEAEYELDSNSVPLSAWCSGDPTPKPLDGGPAVETPTLTGEALCGTTQAMVMHSSLDYDWGSLCGWNGIGTPDHSTYEGMAFWAKAPGNKGKSFTLALDDANTSASGGICHVYTAADGGVAGSTTLALNDPNNPGTVITGVATATKQPDECGNSYTVSMAVTSAWAFYTIPWAQFTQLATPNRVPNAHFKAGNVPGTGLLTDQLMGLGVRFPKEAPIDLWFADITFYRRKKVQTPGRDAGLAAEHDVALNAGPDLVPDLGLDAGLDAALALDADLVLDAELALDAGLGTELDAVPSVDVN